MKKQALTICLLMATKLIFASYTQFYSENFETGYANGDTDIAGWTIDQNGQTGDRALKISSGFTTGGFCLRGGSNGNTNSFDYATGGFITSAPDTFNTVAGNVTEAYTIQSGDYLRVTFRNPIAIQHGPLDSRRVFVEFFYWESDSTTKVTIDTEFSTNGKISNGADTGHLSYHAIAPEAADGKRLGVKFTMAGDWSPTIDEITLAYERTTDMSNVFLDSFVDQLKWTGGNWIIDGNTGNARSLYALQGASGATATINYSDSLYTINTTYNNFTIKWVNCDTREYPSNAGNYGIKVGLGYFDDSQIFQPFITNGETAVSGAIENSFDLTPTIPAAASGKKLGVKITFEGGWEPAIDNLLIINNDPLTPAIGLSVTQTDNELSWSVEEEIGVKAYQVVDAETEEILETVVATGEGTYQTTVSEGVTAKLVVEDKSGFKQTFIPADGNVETVTYDLAKGWNLITVTGDNADTSELGTAFWAWNGTAYETITSPEPTKAIWVYSDNVTQATVTTEKTDAQMELKTGWNMVGPVENCQIPDNAHTVYGWNRVYDLIADEQDTLIRGVGYWIFSAK